MVKLPLLSFYSPVCQNIFSTKERKGKGREKHINAEYTFPYPSSADIPYLSWNENHHFCQALLASHHFICSHLYLMLLSTVQQSQSKQPTTNTEGNSNKHESSTIIQPSCLVPVQTAFIYNNVNKRLKPNN